MKFALIRGIDPRPTPNTTGCGVTQYAVYYTFGIAIASIQTGLDFSGPCVGELC